MFGSYGSGEATITQGVWFVGSDWLTFDKLALGPGRPPGRQRRRPPL